MFDTLRRISGILLMLISASALFLTVFGIIKLWEIKDPVTTGVVYNLELISTTLSTSSNGLVIVDEAVDTAKVNIASLELATAQLAASIRDTQPLVTSFRNMIGEEVPAAITATQISLNSAARSALLVDQMLEAIANIPLLRLDRYVPDPPLNETLRDVSSNLEDITPSLETMAESLDTAGTNLDTIEERVSDIGDQIGGINQNLENAKLIIEDYQTTIADLQDQITEMINRVPGVLNSIFWAITFVLGWLIVTQITLFTIGYSHIRNRKIS